MIKYFQIKKCPLCSKSLRVSYLYECTKDYESNTALNRSYCCDTHFYPEPIYLSENKVIDNNYTGTYIMKDFPPHYEVVCSGSIIIQRVIIPPYLLQTFSDTSRTQIYALPKENTNKCSLIMEVPAVVPDEPEKLLKKIKLLIPFS